MLAAVAIGLAGALGAVIFRLLIRFFTAAFFSGAEGLAALGEEGILAEPGDPLSWARELSWWRRLLPPALGGLLVGPLVYWFAREARGHGIPEVMKAVALRGGVIRTRVAFVKIFASAITIGSGGSAGREGPIVQIGSAVGSWFGQVLKVPVRQLRTMVGCGAAAGIAATFNAPIAGALFAGEVIIGDFAVSSFSPIVVSAVVATVVSRFFLGNHPAFEVPGYDIVSPFELAPYMVVGVLAGLVGVAFIVTLGRMEEAFERVRFPEPLKASLGGLLVGTIGVFLPEVYGVGYTTITACLHGALPAMTLGLLLVAKILATSITLGSGGSGGIFAPSLFLGAVAGGFAGTFIHQWFPDATASSGAYALVTMGAVVAATTHAPISAFVVIFELTQTIDIIPALMVACVLSTVVSQLLSRDSIYTAKLRRQGIDLFKREDPNVLKNLFVRDVVDREPEVIPASATFENVLDLVVRSRHAQFYVTNQAGELLGAISLSEVRRLIFERDTLRHVVVAGDLVDTARPTVNEQNDLDLVMHLFSGADYDELAVVDELNPRRLVGCVREKDVIEARNREWLRRDMAGGLTSHVGMAHGGRRADLGGGFFIEEVVAPPQLIGRTLREIDLRRRTRVHVLLLRSGVAERAGEGDVRVPGAEDVIREGDFLVLAGTDEDLRRLERLEQS